MTIIEKLNLQQQLGGVVLFKEGLFLRAYNESAYILTALLGHDLKIKCYQAKGANKKWITVCGFPYNKLSERLPRAVLTDFGCQLAGDYEVSGYLLWHERRCRDENNVNVAAKAGNESLKTYEQPAPSPPMPNAVHLTSVNLPLTQQQFTYLLNWQKGMYPVEVEQGFIESLKRNLRTKAFY